MNVIRRFGRALGALAWMGTLAVAVGGLARAEESDATPAPPSNAKDSEESAPKDSDAPAGEKKKDDAPKRPPTRNPLTDLIRKSLKPGKAPSGEMPGVALPNAPDGKPRKTGDRHGADPRAPYDRKAGEWIRKAGVHIQAGEWNQALELLQRVTDQAEDSLYRTEAGQWVSIRTEADRLRGLAPLEVLADYRKQYGGLARQLLAEAIRTGDLASYGRVAKGYFHTEAGYEAANRLASLHLDRGEFPLAAHWFSALWQARAPLTGDRQWRSKAAYALKQAGQGELGAQLVDPAGGADRPVDLGGTRHEPARWLAGAALVAAPAEAPLADWPLFFGTPKRTGVVQGGEPLLLPRWRLPLTESHPVRTQLEQLAEDLGDQGTFAPTALFPVMVGGKVIFRTLHGVQVVDAQSGRPLWESDESQPLERLLSGSGGAPADPAGGGMFPAQMRGMVRFRGGWNGGLEAMGGQGEYSPLCNLLYRNASFGIVSSDGRQLFVVDDPEFLSNRQPGNPWQWDGSQAGPPNPGSRLLSYDLESGRPRWEVGGVALGEPFDPPLAGYFFFGAPVADAGELYVVAEATTGEEAGQIRLLALDQETGAPRWSQLIAYTEVGIEKDIGRRWWTAPVAVDGGILLCPTTVGWYVAVDRVTRTLLWGFRARQPGMNQNRQNMGAEQHEQMAMVQNTPLGGNWCPAPPVLAEGRVVCSSLEAQSLLCLDQFTGKELWSKPRGNGMYLAGVFDGRVVVVGREGIAAFDLAGGTPQWNVKTAIPSGRGVAVAGRYELPLSTGEVWSIQLADGRVAGRTYLPSQVPSIGNLAMYRGVVLSLDAGGLTAFEQREAVQSEIARRKRDDPRDPWALIREAEISSLGRDQAATLAALRQVDPSRASAELAERRRRLLVESLSAVVRADFLRPETDADLRELEQIVAAPDERRLFRRLQTDLFVARGQFDQAFDAYLALVADDAESLVPRDDTPGTQVQTRRWAAGKLADLLAAIPADQRAPFDKRVAGLAREAQSRSETEQERFLELFPEHPAAIAVRRALAEHHAAAGDLIRAERLLRQLARTPDPAVAAQALERLARLLDQFDLPADAAQQYRVLERHYGKVVLADGRTAEATVQALRDAGRFPVSGAPVADWQAASVRVDRMGANYVNHVDQELAPDGASAPYFQHQRFEVDPAGGRLMITDGASQDLRWSLPLRSHASSPEGAFVSGLASGHALTLVHRGVIHALSPAEQKVLWTRGLEGRQAAQGHFGRNVNPVQPMQPSLNLANRQMHQQSLGAGAGPLVIAQDDYIACLGRRTLMTLDARTGETLWSYSGLRPGSFVFGGQRAVYIRPADGQNGMALRAADGRRLELDGLADALQRAVAAVGDRIVLPVSGGGAKGGLRLFDPLTQQDVWKVDLAKGTLLSVLPGDRLALLETGPAGGKFQCLDLATGELRLLGTFSADELKGRSEIFALADNQNVYLIINKGMNQNFYSENVPFVRANGLVAAFDPESARLRWKQIVTGQSLLLERLDYAPWLVFSARRYEQKGKMHFWSMHLVAIDKLSGVKLLDEKSSGQPGLRSVTVSSAERYIELRGYNDRVRLYAVEKPAAAGEAGD